MRCLVVTGTSTGVGKTVVTSALTRVALDQQVATSVVKPVQTGISTSEPTDIETVRALSGCERCTELVRLDDPLAPDTAARLRGVAIPSVAQLATSIVEYAEGDELVIVEGAGGLLVRLDTAGGTVLTLAHALRQRGCQVGVVVVTTLELGTLNHTELTVRAAADAGQDVAGLVIGSIPEEPDLAARCNLDDLPRLSGVRVLGGIPAGAGNWDPARFREVCSEWLPPEGWMQR